MTSTNSQTRQTERSRPLDAGACALWASAFVLMGLILMQAGQYGSGPAAHAAGSVSEDEGMTILTARSQNDEDVLVVIEQATERLFVFGVENNRSIRAYDARSLPQLFGENRSAPGAGPATPR